MALRRRNWGHLRSLLLVVGLLISWPACADAQIITEYPVPIPSPYDITLGPDGALWFIVQTCGPPNCQLSGQIGRVTTSGAVAEYPVPTPGGIAAGSDGALWFTEPYSGKIGRITTKRAITEYTIPISGSAPTGITAGPDGALWFGDNGTDAIGRITTSGKVTEYALSAECEYTRDIAITPGPEGTLWFTQGTPFFQTTLHECIGRITMLGAVTEYQLPLRSAKIDGNTIPNATPGLGYITAGPDGALWFTEANIGNIGRITISGTITEFSIPVPNNSLFGISAGPDGALWFTASGGCFEESPSACLIFVATEIGRITTSGVITEYPTPATVKGLWGIAAGPDGAMWFTDPDGSVGRITTPLSIHRNTGDFNGDRKSDILWQNANGQAAIWLMNGTTATTKGLVGANPGPSWRVIGSGDFNGDGYSDILWQNTNGAVAIWEMNGTKVIASVTVGNLGTSWHAIGSGDFNGDGKSDILLQNANGAVSIWLMNGTKVIGSGSPGNPGPSWHAIGE